MKKAKKVSMLMLLMLVLTNSNRINAQVDIYKVVNATDDLGETHAADKDSSKEDSTEKEDAGENAEGEETQNEVLVDIRTMLLGILFATSWSAGAVTYGTFGKAMGKKV